MPASKYFNRELSWIEFNARVLHEARRNDVPLLERLKFLAIVSSNFAEFFQVRVASIMRQARQAPSLPPDADGLPPEVLLQKIAARCHTLIQLQYQTLTGDLLPALAGAGWRYVPPSQYTPAHKAHAESLFRQSIAPLLTPLRTDAPEFPHISSQHDYAAFKLLPVEGLSLPESELSPATGTEDIVALVQIPANIPRLVWLPAATGEPRPFTTADDIIAQYGAHLFPGYRVAETMLFTVERDADFSVDEESGTKFIQAMEEVLAKRQSSFPVRLLCNSSSPALRHFIQAKLQLPDDDVYRVDGMLDPSILLDLTAAANAAPHLYPRWHSYYPDDLPQEGSYWNTLRQHDVLLHMPYQTFDPIVKFLQDAARDEQVLAIKMTLYRTGSSSPIVSALKEAAHNGKSVTVLVELKARFDEQRNIAWATELEKAGATVIYGVAHLKVHAKLCLIIRQESDGLRRYAHLSTGNYNPKTAKLYQDLSILTSNHEIVSDATFLFNVISGYSALLPMRTLFMAPVTLKSRLLELIGREAKQCTADAPGLIMAKMNSLCHREIIDALYAASQQGVHIKLNVRGICTLVPGAPGQSQNIVVTSVIDRYLEHSRIFYFQNGGEEELYLSSADWMERNLDRRIELMFPVTDAHVFKTVKEALLLYFQDNTQSHTLQSDGTWQPRSPGEGEEPVRAQEVLHQHYKKRNDKQKTSPKQEFEVRRKD